MSAESSESGLAKSEVKRLIVLLLRERREGMTKAELVAAIGQTSGPTVQRALNALRDEDDAPIDCDREYRWKLLDRGFTLPIEAPEAEDLLAVLLAEAMLEPIADGELKARLRRLAEQLDQRIRPALVAPHRGAGARDQGRLPARALSSTLSMSTRIEPDELRMLLETTRKGALKIRYVSPWDGREDDVTIEPWSVRLHDGAAYVRAWCREAGAPRTYRVAHIEEMERVVRPGGRRDSPPAREVWGEQDPRYGIDHDRPGKAVVRLRGGVARWVGKTVWHRGQRDEWIEPGEVLERTLPYRSCRELARRLLSVIDGVVGIEPAELRAQVEENLERFRAREEGA